jgi:hypothetical protein
MNAGENECGFMMWIDLVEDMGEWRALQNRIMIHTVR